MKDILSAAGMNFVKKVSVLLLNELSSCFGAVAHKLEEDSKKTVVGDTDKTE